VKLPRRRFLHLAAGGAALPAMPRVASALNYPTRPVRIIVGYAAAGPTDIAARLVGQWLSERLGQSFVVDNRPGAATNIGTELAVRAPPDGYTLLLVNATNAINTTLYDKLNFNFIRDIVPVASIMRTTYLMVVQPLFPAKSVPEFITYAKANPGKINMATAGVGSPPHVNGELFKAMAGVIGYVRAGKLRARRSPPRRARRRAGHPYRERIRARLRGKRLVWHRCAQRHSTPDH
jgi:tripartite-type tricarboxylate transporter receptor subunit TctC